MNTAIRVRRIIDNDYFYSLSDLFVGKASVDLHGRSVVASMDTALGLDLVQTFERVSDRIDPGAVKLENWALLGDETPRDVLAEEVANCAGMVLARYCRMSVVSGLSSTTGETKRIPFVSM